MITININPQAYGSINSEHYFGLLAKNDLTEEEQSQVLNFEKIMAESERYRDNLVGSLKKNKDSYENGIINRATIASINPGGINPQEQRAIEAYNISKSHLREIQAQKTRRLTKDTSSGYTNAFALILSVLGTGILIGVVLFMMMK